MIRFEAQCFFLPPGKCEKGETDVTFKTFHLKMWKLIL